MPGPRRTLPYLQPDALFDTGVAPRQIYQDEASGKRDDRPGLAACLEALRKGDVLVGLEAPRHQDHLALPGARRHPLSIRNLRKTNICI